MTLLEERYKNEVAGQLMAKYGYKNPLEVPRLEKVVLNMGLGEAIQNPKVLDSAVEEMAQIAGQRPVITRAKKSIAAFKVREGMPIGCRVTLRRRRMYDFLARLMTIALPRVRDFRGVSPRAFDGRGNYTLGIREHIIFPEVDYDSIDKVKGMNVTIVTTAETDDEARDLLAGLGMPFRK
ncbi:50S ribosomal protein L5 [Dissulfurirhabdus thermomarina]|uniref:Large ribosomal subunit protein uL5 n=1 Tax=Dissulfurirhabdus thermomarina TaxID=1765737 RepID=A0A6N9TLL7_DISTH|nr:50S ribosomal protein L5 [Dissulfurirhabdus thermomarina]NDY41320.1 50S ribosomal protein L5 [Dissulfurirhabdus thermomarina]NMX23297.1 50S ribosomal protein L5 [Dissulfurirhabdus thermomarina]